MNTRQIAELAGVSTDTVRRKSHELFPKRLASGRTVTWTQNEAIAIVQELRKKGFIELPQNAEVQKRQLPQNAEVQQAKRSRPDSDAAVSARLDRMETIVERLCFANALLSEAVSMTLHKELRTQIGPPIDFT